MPVPQAIAALIDLLRQAADREALSHDARLDVVSAVRRAIVHKQKAGRKNDERLDRAYTEFRTGTRGLELYRKHIPNFRKLSRWRRRVEGDRLLKTLNKRAERERKRQPTPTNADAELSPRQSVRQDCRADNALQQSVAADPLHHRGRKEFSENADAKGIAGPA